MVSKREAIRLADDADLDLVYILPLIFFFFFPFCDLSFELLI